MSIFSELADELRDAGEATVMLGAGVDVRIARNRLIEAAQDAGLRITFTREADRVIGHVMTAAAGEAQRTRDAVFRAANQIKQGIEQLTSGSIDAEPVQPEIDDLRDIVEALETYARGLIAAAAE